MLSAPALDLTFGDDDWVPPPSNAKLYRAASVGNSWGVTSIGRGFDWDEMDDNSTDSVPRNGDSLRQQVESALLQTDDFHLNLPKRSNGLTRPRIIRPISAAGPQPSFITASPIPSNEPLSSSPLHSRSASPQLFGSPKIPHATSHSPRPPPSRSPSSPRPRRRSSQQRVSLVAGRVLIAPMGPPSPPPPVLQTLHRADSKSSLLSVAASTGPPTPQAEREPSLGGRSISEFVIEREIGRGAYGLVKRAREKLPDGSLGPPLVIKQIIKSRILADCWKKHPKHGTIPIEIYVMSAISSTSYVLPARRPWSPSRPAAREHVGFPSCKNIKSPFEGDPDMSWTEGQVYKGHPNICPLLDFFEDNHYYYLVLPSTTPEQQPNEPPVPSDLFDLVESYPHGLPASSVRSYLGQIADALCFLHSQGIVHRDVKDENVVLGPAGKVILIDFGSSGLVKRGGWDTFSGTLDYAGPEILRGERYQGKEQDVWAFGVVAYVLLVGECPFTTAAEAQEGMESPFTNASIALDERCGDDRENEGEEEDGGGALGDAAALVRACLQVQVAARPSFDRILQSRFLQGQGGWGMEIPYA